MKNALVVFARAPEPGKVKTRLAKSIGDEAAAALYAAMLRDTLELAQRAVEDYSRWEVWLAYTPDDAFEDRPYSLAPFWSGPRLAQSSGDLGQRLFNCIAQLQNQGAAAVVVIGSDSPNLPHDYLSRAVWNTLDPGNIITHLDGVTASYANLIFGPTPDGGFYLMGVRNRLPATIFQGAEWSSEKTLSQIVANAEQLGLRVWLDRIWDDIDTIEDLRKLSRRVVRNRLHDCAAATQEWLRSHDLSQNV